MNGDVLGALTATEGVHGALALDENGNCICHSLRPPFDPPLLSGVVRRLFLAFDAFSSIDGGDVMGFFVECEDGTFLLRHVDQRWLVALTSPDVNVTMLNLAMNVVAIRLSRAAPDAGTRPAAQVPQGQQPPPQVPPPLPKTAPRGSSESASTQVSSSSILLSSTIGNDIPSDAVDRTIVQRLLAIYTDYLGPAARLVFKQELAALGVTSRTLRRTQVGELVSSLTARIPVPERQAEFEAAAREYRERMLI